MSSKTISFREKTIIRRWLIPSGIMLGLGFGIGVYLLAYSFREIFRIQLASLEFSTLLILTPSENFYWNLFYSSIASNIGLLVFFQFILRNCISSNERRNRFRIRNTLSEQGYLLWTHISAIGRFISLVGILYMFSFLQYEVDFLNDFWLLLVLIPMSFFLSIFSSLNRLSGINSSKLFFKCFVYVSVLSVSLAFLNISDYKQINENLRTEEYLITKELDVPRSATQDHLKRRFFEQNIFIDLAGDSLKILLDHPFKWIKIGEIEDYLKKVKNERLFRRDAMNVILHFNKNIPVRHLYDITSEISKCPVNQILIRTGPIDDKYPSYHPQSKFSGIFLYQPETYPELSSFLDSVENTDLTGKKILIPNSRAYRIDDFESYNRIKISVDSLGYRLNGNIITKEDLKGVMNDFVTKYTQNHVVIFDPALDISIGKYIESKDLIISQYRELRNEYSLANFGKPFKEFYPWDYEYSHIRKMIPTPIIEWTRDEKRLLKIIERTELKKH